MTLDPYIGVGGNVEYAPPIYAEGIRMYGFLLPVDRAHLDRLFAGRFVDPSGGAVLVAAAAPFVLAYVSATPAIRLRDDVGWYREREAGIMAFGIDLRRRRLFTTLDYLFVDSGQAMANGREVFGFPKQIGRFPVDEWLDGQIAAPQRCPEALDLHALGVAGFAPDSWAAETELWRAEVADAGRPRPITDPSAMLDLAAQAMRDAGSSELVDGMLRPFVDGVPRHLSVPYRAPLGAGGEVVLDLHPGDPYEFLPRGRMPVPLASLADVAFNLSIEFTQNRLSLMTHKQIRSAVRPSAAVYSSILELDASRTIRSLGVLPADYTFHIASLDSAPIAETYGWDGPVRSLLSMYSEYDFTIGNARALWSSSTSHHEGP